MSISYELAFWKWKIMLSCNGSFLFPKHSLTLKRIFITFSNYQQRLVHFALFKLALNFKSNQFTGKAGFSRGLAQAISNEIQNEDREMPRLQLNLNDSQSEFELNEVGNITKIGAFEILGLQFKAIIRRKLSWVLSAIYTNSKDIGMHEDEKYRLFDKINELRNEKHRLVEDSNSLRMHNDLLISSLKKSTEGAHGISLKMDYLKISSMIRIINKAIVVEYSAIITTLKLNLFD
jgi:hypothetical protein